MKFKKLFFDDFFYGRDIKVVMSGEIGDIPRSVKDGAKDFGLETLDALDVGCFCRTP